MQWLVPAFEICQICYNLIAVPDSHTGPAKMKGTLGLRVWSLGARGWSDLLVLLIGDNPGRLPDELPNLVVTHSMECQECTNCYSQPLEMHSRLN